MNKIIVICVCLWIFTGCVNTEKNGVERIQPIDEKAEVMINENGLNISERISVPEGYTRKKVEEN